MQVILVTGGLGFIGLETIKALKQSTHDRIVCVDYYDRIRALTDRSEFNSAYVDNVFDVVSSVYDVVEPQNALKLNADTIIHLGAVVDTTAPALDLMRENVDYTRSLATAFHHKKFIFASSAATYGVNDRHPMNVYGLTKKIGEKLVYGNAAGCAILRFFNVYGPFEHHKGKMASMPFKAALAYTRGSQYDLFCPDAARDFIHVSDVAAAIVSCYTNKLSGTFDVGSAEATSFEDMDRLLMTASNSLTSLAHIVPMPTKLKNQYQTMTCAKKRIPARDCPRIPRQFKQGAIDLISEMRKQ